MKKLTFTILFLFASIAMMQAQFGIGVVTGGDTYQRYINPNHPSDSGAYRSAGNVLLNGGIGPKIWVGGRRFSLSIESQVIVATTAFNMREYKGLGAVAFPIMAHLNFRNLSSFSNNSFGTGFAIGGGVQYSRTEWFGLTRKFEYLERKLFPTYVLELQAGGGGKGVTVYGYVRYGLGLDENMERTGASSLNLGISTSFNITQMMRNAKNEKSNSTSDDGEPKKPIFKQ